MKHLALPLLTPSELQAFLDCAEFELNTGCWLWSRGKDKYGSFKGYRTHRLAYRNLVGEFDEALLICHHCDTPACINPAHLFPGTPDDNNRDMCRKGRATNLLSREDIFKVVIWKAQGVSHSKIALKLGVSESTIHAFSAGRTYQTIPRT